MNKFLPGIGILICFFVGFLLNLLVPLNYYIPTVGIIVTFFILKFFLPDLVGQSGESKWWYWIIIVIAVIVFISVAYYASATSFSEI